MHTRLRLIMPSWSNFTVCGSDGDDDQTDTTQDGSADQGPDSDKDKDDKDKTRDPEARIRALVEERDRHARARKAEEAELNELRQLKADQDKAKLTETERAERELKDRDSKIESAAATIRRLAIENAFLGNNTVKWNNAADALRLADLDDIKVGDDGKVSNPDSLKDVIEKLSKDKPYLVASEAPAEDPKDKKNPPAATGTPPVKKPPTDRLDPAFLASKYGSLRTH